MIRRWASTFCRPLYNKRSYYLADQRGQATIEYILLLSVSVMVILGALYQFNDAFRKFTKSYFGDYVTCLLEAGELPNVQGGLCEASYKPFSLAEGRPLIGDPITPGSGGVGGQNSDGKGSSGRDGKGNGRGTSSDSGQSEKSDPSIRASSGGGSSGMGGKFQPKDSLNAAMNKRGIGKNGSASDGDLSSSSSGRGYASYRSGSTRNTTSAFDKSLGRLRYIPQNKDEKDAAPISSDQKIEVTDSDKKRMRGGLVSAQRGQRQETDIDLDPGFSFGNLLRYFLITAIILVIVLFLGGQAMALKKGQEKG